MPSYVHELLLLLFRNRSQAAADLLRSLDVRIPEFDEVRIESADLNHASAGIDAEHSRLYLDLILLSLSEKARRALQSMNSLGFEYQSDFARKYVAQGRAEGKAEGRAEIVLKQLTRRFGPLGADTQTRVCRATDSQLDTVAEELLTAPTLAIAVKAIT
jgi:hypothetical protein